MVKSPHPHPCENTFWGLLLVALYSFFWFFSKIKSNMHKISLTKIIPRKIIYWIVPNLTMLQIIWVRTEIHKSEHIVDKYTFLIKSNSAAQILTCFGFNFNFFFARWLPVGTLGLRLVSLSLVSFYWMPLCPGTRIIISLFTSDIAIRFFIQFTISSVELQLPLSYQRRL